MPVAAPKSPDAPQLLEQVLDQALAKRASDIHFEPTATGYELRLRIDGLLSTLQTLDPESGRGMVNRLMVMGQLLTYRLDVPQEGRINAVVGGGQRVIEGRLAIMPTTHGLRAAVRLAAEADAPLHLDELGLGKPVLNELRRFAGADQGMLLLTGPAGSGKTTTIYALLRHILTSASGLSVISLEDPVERDLPGVTQIEVTPFGQLSYERALRSILRQDPQVLALGEIRDRATASIAVQAALSGHRLISTLHAGTPGSAIARLLEMGLEPYQLTGALFGIVSQRLLRRKKGAGYEGRLPVAEFARIDEAVRDAILGRGGADALSKALRSQAGYRSLADAAGDLVAQGLTDLAEVHRVLGQAADSPGGAGG